MADSNVRARTEGSQALRKVLGFTFRQWGERKGLVVLVALCMVLSTITEVVVPVFAGRLVDAVALGQSAAGEAVVALVTMASLGLAMILLRHCGWWAIVPLTLSMMRNIAQGGFHRVQRFS